MNTSLGVGEGGLQAKSLFKSREEYKYRHIPGNRGVSRTYSKGLMALQQLCEVGRAPIPQMRDVELAQARQDLASVLIARVRSWPPSTVESLE